MIPPEAPATKVDAGIRGFVAALGIAQICSWGTLYYSFALIAEAMRVDLGWSKTEIYGAAAFGLVFAGIAAYPVGLQIDRGRGRYVMSIASLAAGFLLVMWSQMSNILVFYAIFAAIGCMQAATLYEPAFAVIARRVGAENVRQSITALTLWGGFASTVFIPLIQYLIDCLGWRGALVILGAVNLACSGLYFLSIDPARDHPDLRHQSRKSSSLDGRKAVAWVMRRPVFWTLLIALLAYQAMFAILTFHLYPLLLERGMDSAGVVSVLAMIGPAQVAGRFLFMVFAARASVIKIGVLVVALFPIAVAGLIWAPANASAIAMIAVLYGVANGMMTIVRGTTPPEMITRDAYGAINGAIAGPMNIVLAISPLAAASIWLATGSYDAVLIAVAASAGALCLGFWAAAAFGRGPARCQ